MLSSDHLTLRLIRLNTGEEWSQTRSSLAFLFSKGGSGKCISPTETQPILPGDMLILSGVPPARLVSTNGGMVFWSFSLALEHLFPLFGGSEISLLQSVSERLRSFKHYPSRNALAAQCQKLVGEVPPDFDLDHRSQLLRIAAAVLADEFKTARERFGGLTHIEDRLIRVFEQLTADDILSLSIDELAQRFSCSRRHLNRLFHQYFKLSVASLKMEMRLLKAVSLLRDPAAKIINVAEGCGFHHLGLFNTCFRKRFGTSPGDWRKRGQSAEKAYSTVPHSAPDCPLRDNGLCPWNSTAFLGLLSNGVPGPSRGSRRKPHPHPDAKSPHKKVKKGKKKFKVVSNGVSPAHGPLKFKITPLPRPARNAQN